MERDKPTQPLKLPQSVVGPQDLLHLEREADRLVEERLQARVAKKETGVERGISEPGQRMTDLFNLNGLTLDEATLPLVARQLHELRSKAPRVRLSLATEPSPESIGKVVGWFREHIHSQILLQVGIQPAIAAGCVLHTSKRRYDWAIRTKLNNSTASFVKALNG